MKYVIFTTEGECPIEIPVILADESTEHSAIKLNGLRVVSAGFIRIGKAMNNDIIASCYGKSISLMRESRSQDSEIFTRYLNQL